MYQNRGSHYSLNSNNMAKSKETNSFSPELREELLRKQLLSFSIAHEMNNVIGSARHIQGVCQSLGLGLRDMMNFENTAVFTVNPANFCLDIFHSTGFAAAQFQDQHFGLNFLDGQYSDVIFLNRHVIIDEPTDDDPFKVCGCDKYILFPIMARVFLEDGSVIKCQDNSCPCQKATNPSWWADADYIQSFEGLTEDKFRNKVLKCSAFKCFGVLLIDLSTNPDITSDQVTIVNSVLVHTGLILENFQIQKQLKDSFIQLEVANGILEKTNAENLRELNKAHKIQNALLPTIFPERSINDVAAFYVPASKVGGDYYDCFEIDETRTVLLIADVSGHGVSAGLIMSMFKVLIKTFSKGLATPSQILTRINQILLDDVNSDHFVTCFFGIYDESNRELEYCNAGHKPILMMEKESKAFHLESTNIFVGAVEDMMAEDRRVTLAPDTRLILYTDGVTEAMNADSIQFEMEAFQECCELSRDTNCQDSLDKILLAVDNHRQGQAFADDLTLMIIDL